MSNKAIEVMRAVYAEDAVGNSVMVRIRSWYPGWLVGLMVRYALWRESRGNNTKPGRKN